MMYIPQSPWTYMGNNELFIIHLMCKMNFSYFFLSCMENIALEVIWVFCLVRSCDLCHFTGRKFITTFSSLTAYSMRKVILFVSAMRNCLKILSRNHTRGILHNFPDYGTHASISCSEDLRTNMFKKSNAKFHK